MKIKVINKEIEIDNKKFVVSGNIEIKEVEEKKVVQEAF